MDLFKETKLTDESHIMNDFKLLQARQSLKPVKQFVEQFENGENPHVFIIIGGTEEIALQYIYPALWHLYEQNLLPNTLAIFSLGILPINNNQFRDKCQQYFKIHVNESENLEKLDKFWNLHQYIYGNYNERLDYDVLKHSMLRIDRHSISNRIFYLAQPLQYLTICAHYIKMNCISKNGWNRIIIQKPYDNQELTINSINSSLRVDYPEIELYRFDHYLCKDIVENILILRFANRIFNGLWDRTNIASVLITYKDNHKLFHKNHLSTNVQNDSNIIKDILQYYLLQIVTLICMEKPLTFTTLDIQTEKIKLLRSILPVNINDCVIGQYIGYQDDLKLYLDEKLQNHTNHTNHTNNTNGDSNNSAINDMKKNYLKLPTYMLCVLHINNERWHNVPFIINCGHALNEPTTEIRIQYQDINGDIFGKLLKRNELLIRLQPNEELTMKLMLRSNNNIDLNIDGRNCELFNSNLYSTNTAININSNTTTNNNDSVLDNFNNICKSYERLINDVLNGCRIYFPCSDELNESGRIFQPILNQLNNVNHNLPIKTYLPDSTGPIDAEMMCESNNFLMNDLISEPLRTEFDAFLKSK